MTEKRTTLRADEIIRVLQRRHRRDLWFTEVKDGSTWLRDHHVRLDALAIRPSWTQPRLTGYEVKVTRSDFLRDEKWDAYLPLTHQFSFACPWDLIQPEELTTDVGLYWVSPEGRIKQVRKPVLRPMRELPTALLYYVILSRLDSEHHPFFSGAREAIEAFLADKTARQELGRSFRSRLVRQVTELQQTLRQTQKERDMAVKRWEERAQTCRDLGLPSDPWSFRSAIQRLQAGTAGVEDRRLTALVETAQDLLRQIHQLQTEGS